MRSRSGGWTSAFVMRAAILRATLPRRARAETVEQAHEDVGEATRGAFVKREEELGLDELGLHEQRAGGARHEVDARVRRRAWSGAERRLGDRALRGGGGVDRDRSSPLGMDAEVAARGHLAHGMAQDAAEVHE